ncbi:hypothetical protein [Desulfospira joergensenii]|uniref:hypothetical protein n=1 Tax=Desulfospira joergensenii TaxID=53329 RepID=UPI0003B3F08B|nr:hypothetical protein [Desulfospira joergensenii]
MIHLFLSIACSTSILILFKVLERRKIRLLLPIMINYMTAAGLGLILNQGRGITAPAGIPSWFFMSALTGMLLIGLFFIIGLSTQKAGIAVTTIATKMSVVIPMLFSILYFQEGFTPLKCFGIVMGMTALALIVVKTPDKKADRRYLFLPLVLFTGAGLLDALLKLVQQNYLLDGDPAAFTGTSFFFAFVTGLGICLVQKVPPKIFFKPEILLSGLVLGSVNFGSIYFLIRTLDRGLFDASILFGLNSIGIVCLSIFLAALLFRERLSGTNWTGVALAVLAILTFARA